MFKETGNPRSCVLRSTPTNFQRLGAFEGSMGLVKKTRKPDKSASRVWGTVLDKPKAQNLVALPAPPVHSSGGALPRFRRGNSGSKQPLTLNHFFSSPDMERYQRSSSQVAQPGPTSQALEYPSNSLGSELS
ncbi:hypothetical protein PIB30_065183 [Stylosanthes scabra]|uniref:Uncharacterized protein n=1 Tax=Stylosanthes scabra TaxID=79078 RepID=A0ABU6WK94_9FABA|nr:hypothetical protein [Stylosanthes scabra]